MEQIPPRSLHFESKIMCFNYRNQSVATGIVWLTSMQSLHIFLLSMPFPRGHHHTVYILTHFVGCIYCTYIYIHLIYKCISHISFFTTEMHPKYWLQRLAKYPNLLTNKSRKSSLLTGWKMLQKVCC